MSDWNLYNFSRDLSAFIELIMEYDIPVELKELTNLDSQLQYQDAFNMTVNDIVFTIDRKIAGTIPFDVDTITIYFSHTCKIDEGKDCDLYDPISSYDFQLYIRAYDKNAKEYINCWHLDKNIESKPPKFTHPYYHFQAGGNSMEGIDSGGLVLLGSPRLPHPPMDLFLGIHFIFNNFFSSKDYDFVNLLLSDDTYKGIIMRAQDRMWKQYFNAFSLNAIHSDFTVKNIFPLFI